MLLCPFPADAFIGNETNTSWFSNRTGVNCSRRPSPLAVSITVSPCEDPINLIKVVDLPAERNRSSTPSFPQLNATDLSGNTSKSNVLFAVCVRPLYGNSITVQDIAEFIEVNMVFGAQLFFFYVDDSVNAKVRRCLEHYERLGVAETTAWSMAPDLDREAPEKGQYFAMTECQYRMMYRTKYLVIVDVDEFIVPMRTENWLSMLTLINSDANRKNGDSIASYNFRNRFFMLENEDFDPPLPDGMADSSNPTNWTRTFKTLSKLSGQVHLHPWKQRSKVLASPERVLVWHTHMILDRHVVPPGQSNVNVDKKDGVMHHYRKGLKLDQPSLNYTRMWHFSHKISPRLKESLALIDSF